MKKFIRVLITRGNLFFYKMKQYIKSVKNSVFFRKKTNTIISVFLAVLLLSLIISILNCGYYVFTYAYKFEKYSIAQTVQAWKFNSDSTKDNINKFVLEQMNNYFTDFSTEKTSYDDTIKKLEIAERFYKHTETKEKVNLLHSSRIAFQNGQMYENKQDLYNSILEYSKVIELDKNYNIAKQKIETNKKMLKLNIISQLDSCSATGDYTTGLSIISNIEKIFPNDTDITVYKDEFSKLKSKHDYEVYLQNAIAECDLSTADGIQRYLELKYSKMENTLMGDIEFNIDVRGNSVRIIAYDYDIDISFSGMYTLAETNTYTIEERKKMDSLLRNYMKKLAEDIISKVPGKKFQGKYNGVHLYHMWCNYAERYSGYDVAKASTFRWVPYCSNFYE